jgi:pimeloyl-ACP methyl ester carboxylesterase
MRSNDAESDAAKCRVPALYVGSAAPVADMQRLKELMPHVVLAQTAGAGHFHQLEVPDQVNAMIERFMLINGLERSP